MHTLVRLGKQYPVLAIACGLLAVSQIITSLHIIHEPHPYDRIVHFVFSLFISQLVYLALVDFELLSATEHISRFSTSRIILMVLFIGTTIGVGWEIIEFGSDHLLGSHLQKGNTDTMLDLMADCIGSLCGGILLVQLAKIRDKSPYRPRRRTKTT